MIRVTVELLSAIDSGRSRVLGIAEIANDGTGSSVRGCYDVKLSKWAPKQRETWKRGRVLQFDRITFGAWDLLFLGLFAALGPARVKRLLSAQINELEAKGEGVRSDGS